LSTTPFDFDGKVAVVTGAAQGIGVEISRELASGGATVVVGDVQEETGRATADRLTDETGGLVEFRKLDVADSSAVSTTAGAVVEAHGRVDVLVNNAGVAESSAALDLDDATWQKIVGINLTGTFLCAREFGRRMADAGEGGASSTFLPSPASRPCVPSSTSPTT
jgi:NAD(P)-dependent dehydrogenase (short-subunit alcohol dehydrogenase family)